MISCWRKNLVAGNCLKKFSPLSFGLLQVHTFNRNVEIKKMQKKFLGKEQALQKLRHYCGYQERSHQDVIQKLWDLGVQKKEHDEIVATLIENGYLNEERFALQFAGGKFRINNWGKKKILHALKEKQVSIYNINKALKNIDEEHYQKKLKKLLQKKYQSLKSEQYLVRKKKALDYMLQKGYELSLVSQALLQIEKQ